MAPSRGWLGCAATKGIRVIEHEVPRSPCPHCGAEHDSASGHADGPRPGDLSVCYYCSRVLEFDQNLYAVYVDAERESRLIRQYPELRETVLVAATERLNRE